MADLKISLNAYAVIQRKKLWQGGYSWITIKTLMIPEQARKHFYIDPNTHQLEEKIVSGLQKIDFLPVITRVKSAYEYQAIEPLDQLKHLLSSIYTELQDVKANTEDDELQDLLQHMDSELVTAAKIVTLLKHMGSELVSAAKIVGELEKKEDQS